MNLRPSASLLLVMFSLPLALSLAGCNKVESITINPTTETLSAAGQTVQYEAYATEQMGSGPTTTNNITNSVTWTSSNPNVATINSTGLATAGSVGGVTEIMAASSNGVSASVELTVNISSTTGGGGTQTTYSALTIIPSTVSVSASAGTSNLIALASSGSTGYQTDVTNSPNIQWYSSSPKIASVGLNTGIITGGNVGSTTITAELTIPGTGGILTAYTNVTTTSTPAPEPLISLTIIPSSATMGALKDQVQLLAIGTYATAPFTRDLTNSPNLTWISAFPNDITVDNNNGGGSGATAGVVTVYESTLAAGVPIIAEAVNPQDGTIQTATATVACPLVLPNPAGNPPTPGSCYPGSEGSSLLSTLTVYNEGLNTTSDPGVTANWLITASSATGTADVIHCGPGWVNNGNSGGSVCTATYPVGTTVTLTAPAQKGVNFGGWSYNCAAQGTVTAVGPNTCTVNLTTDETVGAIFN
jgi:uncharacterized protein YjdB